MSDVEIRQYEDADMDGFLSLYARVMGERKTTDWFEWKYVNNPYSDHVPMFVAVHDGSVVGARPFFALPIELDGSRDIALQPCDAMVHPEYRRQGLFTRMTERAIERYRRSHPLFLNFPNDQSLPGNRKLGWRIVSKRPTYYRLERPDVIADCRTDEPAIRLAGKVGTPMAKAYYGVHDRLATTTGAETIRTVSTSPVADLESCYRRCVPDRIHVIRDEEFYGWRLDAPDWVYKTYVGERGSEPTAAIVVGTSVGSTPTTTKLTDIVPLGTAPKSLLVQMIAKILVDHPDTHLFAAPAQGVPDGVLSSCGFHCDSAPPFSLVSTKTTHMVRALGRDWDEFGTDITCPANWMLTFVEADTN